MANATNTKKPVSYPPRPDVSRRAQRYEQRKSRARHRVIAIASAVLLVGAIVAIVAVAAGGGGTTATTTPFNGTTLHIGLGDYTIFGDLTAPVGALRIEAENQGGIIHNVGIRGGPISADVRPGKSFTFDANVLTPGTYQLYCDIVGHVAKGMVADLIITGPVPSTTPAAPAAAPTTTG
jgi:plastocyanin